MSYSHLSSNERYCIDQLYQNYHSLRDIAKCIKRSPSTISREIRRNKESPDLYWSISADKLAKKTEVYPSNKRMLLTSSIERSGHKEFTTRLIPRNYFRAIKT